MGLRDVSVNSSHGGAMMKDKNPLFDSPPGQGESRELRAIVWLCVEGHRFIAPAKGMPACPWCSRIPPPDQGEVRRGSSE
jgi:hypothetical protein